ncbi:YbhN family protein [Mesomycoplasma lagogenitalium]|uniref:YbhN family protein n=1 Tax=Mesomycoplasma lagogenitalium TaxID=171286 RepID=A0ABY8LT58_9BACT|nr:YbhN family protein [Mesomycoplasma lagogenitalium]WGI36437.1 YbhN family protein [Mesomycoplasma lagogenitalium]
MEREKQSIKVEDFNLQNINHYDNLFWNESVKTVDIISSEILARLGDAKQELNENVIIIKALLLRQLLEKDKKNKNIFIYGANDDICYAFKEIFSKVLLANPYNVVFSIDEELNLSSDLAMNEVVNNEYDFVIFILKDKSSEFYKIVFRKNNWEKLSTDEEKFLNKRTLTEISNVEVKSFLNNSLKINRINNNPILNNKNLNIVNKKLKLKATIYSDVNDEENIFNFEDLSTSLKLKKYKNTENKKRINEKTLIRKILTKESGSKNDAIFYINKEFNKKLILIKNKLKFHHISISDLNMLIIEYLSNNSNFQTTPFYFLNPVSNYISDFVKRSGNENTIIKRDIYSIYDFIFKFKNEIPEKEVYVYDGKVISIIKKNKGKITGFESVSNTVLIIKMLEYFKNKKINIFQYLKKIYYENNRERAFHTSALISYNSFLEYVKTIRKEREIASYKLTRTNISQEIKNINKREIDIHLALETKERINLKFNKLKNSLEVNIFSLETKENSYKNIVKKEEKIKNEIIDFSNKMKIVETNKWKNILKFFSFGVIILLVFVILFQTIYKTDDSNDLGFFGIFKTFYDVFLANLTLRTYSLIIVFTNLIHYFLYSIMVFRILKRQKVKILIKHALLSVFISTIVQNITPFSFGGDLASYWYLQKKGYNKQALASTFAVSSLFHQITILFTSLIFIPLGLYLYKDVLIMDINPEKIITLIFMALGIVLNVILFLIILLISTFKRVQKLIISIIIWIYSVNPFYYFIDLSRRKTLLEIKFQEFKDGFKSLFKDSKFFFECLFLYKLSSFLLNGSIIIVLIIDNSILKEHTGYDFFVWYIKFLSGQTLLNMANNLSPVPGGIGTSDWLSTIIFQGVFSQNSNLENNLKLFTFSNKIFYWLIPNIISSLLLLTLYLGEKRIDKYNNISSLIELNPKIAQKYKRTKTSYFKMALSVWILSLTLCIVLLYVL